MNVSRLLPGFGTNTYLRFCFHPLPPCLSLNRQRTAERTSSSRIRIGTIIFNSTSISTETTAAGLGANHQTGWTGLVTKMIELYGRFDPKPLLQEGKRGAHAGGKAEK